mgnify:FL=1
MGLKVLQEQMVVPEGMEVQVLLDPQVWTDLKGRLGQLGLLVPLGLLVRKD